MWKELLLDIRKIVEEDGDFFNSSASEYQIEILKKTVKKKFGINLPQKYIDFLRTVNGFEFNGFIFYGVDSSLEDISNNDTVYGYVENNEIWYQNEHQKQYMFFGESDISWYCFDLFNQVYVELDKPSGALMDTYSDFDTMLEKALKDSLL
ncbi:YrhA family protein [Defluviitalea phaphyphila]|uniref:YrhA family protein n=1 Tax=Defluviitalea phaphyphila TaxID=1473580 RepID=UPI000731AFEF|nr:YrhA family protein [Defluviitalea phaphyphila]